VVCQGVIELTVHFDRPVKEPTVELTYDQPYRSGGEEALTAV
jgi:hypothetical protein